LRNAALALLAILASRNGNLVDAIEEINRIGNVRVESLALARIVPTGRLDAFQSLLARAEDDVPAEVTGALLVCGYSPDAIEAALPRQTPDVRVLLARAYAEAGDREATVRSLRGADEGRERHDASMAKAALQRAEMGYLEEASRFLHGFPIANIGFTNPLDAGFTRLARASLSAGDLDQALTIADSMGLTIEREMFLADLLPALIRNGRPDDALARMYIDGALRVIPLGDVALTLAETGRAKDALNLLAPVPGDHETHLSQVIDALERRADVDALLSAAPLCCTRPAMVPRLLESLARVLPEKASAILG